MAVRPDKRVLMSCLGTTALVLAGCALHTSRAGAEEPQPWSVLPFKMPDIAPLEADAGGENEVEALIASLVEINKPDIGLSSTLSGADFPPVAGAGRRDCLLITRHDIERKDAVTRLVALGPRALPSLLRHLDDATPTRLTITHNYGIGGMWYGGELPTNAALADETRMRDNAGLGTGPRDLSSDSADDADTHVVTVGDVCFVIVGMITNRAYQAVRYQPTACIVLNSPRRKPQLGTAVREMWGGKDVRGTLFDRLMRDFHTRGQGSAQVQAGAAMRLLYYFPKGAAPLIAERLRTLDVMVPPYDSGREILARYKRNGVPESTLIDAVAWSKEPCVVEVLRKIALASDDDGIVASAAPAMVGAGDAAFLAKLKGLFLDESWRYSYANRTSCELLAAIAAIYPDRIEAICREYIATGNQAIAANVLVFCQANRADLAPSVLAPLLDDTRRSGSRETKKPGFKHATLALPIRVCDRAYLAIARSLGDEEAQIDGSIEEMDALIAELKHRLPER